MMFSSHSVSALSICLFLAFLVSSALSAPLPQSNGKKAPVSKSPAPKAEAPKGGAKGNAKKPAGGQHSGEGTFYDAGLGACGITNTNSDMIAAISRSFFDSYPGAVANNPNKNPICGKRLRAEYQGKTVEVAITDRCGGCKGNADLDFSPNAFEKLASKGAGRIQGVKWQFI